MLWCDINVVYNCLESNNLLVFRYEISFAQHTHDSRSFIAVSLCFVFSAVQSKQTSSKTVKNNKKTRKNGVGFANETGSVHIRCRDGRQLFWCEMAEKNDR